MFYSCINTSHDTSCHLYTFTFFPFYVLVDVWLVMDYFHSFEYFLMYWAGCMTPYNIRILLFLGMKYTFISRQFRFVLLFNIEVFNILITNPTSISGIIQWATRKILKPTLGLFDLLNWNFVCLECSYCSKPTFIKLIRSPSSFFILRFIKPFPFSIYNDIPFKISLCLVMI